MEWTCVTFQVSCKVVGYWHRQCMKVWIHAARTKYCFLSTHFFCKSLTLLPSYVSCDDWGYHSCSLNYNYKSMALIIIIFGCQIIFIIIILHGFYTLFFRLYFSNSLTIYLVNSFSCCINTWRFSSAKYAKSRLNRFSLRQKVQLTHAF